MNEYIYLSELPTGKLGYVTSINAKQDMKQRLNDLGVVEGTEIKCIMKSPLGDPVAYLIRGSIIALRREDSETITIALRG